jgi:hypothetical protein
MDPKNFVTTKSILHTGRLLRKLNYFFWAFAVIPCDFVSGSLHHADVSSAADVSEGHSASIFRVEVGRVYLLKYVSGATD